MVGNLSAVLPVGFRVYRIECIGSKPWRDPKSGIFFFQIGGIVPRIQKLPEVE